MQFLTKLFGHGDTAKPVVFSTAARPTVLYAMGDIHGCLDELLSLEDKIVADAAALEGQKWLVYLGDYVDRGPKSAQVLDHLVGPPPKGFQRICLRGNHDTMMLACFTAPRSFVRWLELGGYATLASYGVSAQQVEGVLARGRARDRVELLTAVVPDAHIRFLADLFSMAQVPGYIFVHAGLRPRVPIAKQREDDLIGIRDEFLQSDFDFGATVVHGHSIVHIVGQAARKIGIDTGCSHTGVLTAMRLNEDGSTAFLHN